MYSILHKIKNARNARNWRFPVTGHIGLHGMFVYKCHGLEGCLKPGVHTNDFAPIYGRRAKKLGHASLTTVFRHSRLTFQPILRENLESPLLRYQPITTAVVTDACLNTRWHHGIYIICLERVARYGSGRDNVRGSVGAMNAELS